jgi:deoxyribodipyrimidine photolyase-like uncharacterized protein
VASFGEPNPQRFFWPLNRAEALQDLDNFVDRALPNFGDFEDAMSHRAWRLFHSLLSFALNTKMLNPREVVARAVAAHESGRVPLAAAEGFIRQILGWREYVRGVYWANMPGYEAQNYFDHDNRKPWPGLPREPADWRSEHDHSALWQRIQQAGVASFGEPNPQRFCWPLNRAEALQDLDNFIDQALPNFGDFEDAMSHRAWRLFHSLL